MLYAVFSEAKASQIDDGESHYRTVTFFTDKAKAEALAKKCAKKAQGMPEEQVWTLGGTTKTPEPTDVEIVAAA